jgi:hypothetical protein
MFPSSSSLYLQNWIKKYTVFALPHPLLITPREHVGANERST